MHLLGAHERVVEMRADVLVADVPMKVRPRDQAGRLVPLAAENQSPA